jgi:hypothetical protein
LRPKPCMIAQVASEIVTAAVAKAIRGIHEGESVIALPSAS